MCVSCFFLTNHHKLSGLKEYTIYYFMVSMAQESASGLTGGLGPHQAELRPQRPLPSVLVVGRIRLLEPQRSLRPCW